MPAGHSCVQANVAGAVLTQINLVCTCSVPKVYVQCRHKKSPPDSQIKKKRKKKQTRLNLKGCALHSCVQANVAGAVLTQINLVCTCSVPKVYVQCRHKKSPPDSQIKKKRKKKQTRLNLKGCALHWPNFLGLDAHYRWSHGIWILDILV